MAIGYWLLAIGEALTIGCWLLAISEARLITNHWLKERPSERRDAEGE